MIKLLPILFMSILLSGEMEVDGDLKVTGTVDASGNPITNVGAPLLSTDAVNAGTLASVLSDDGVYEFAYFSVEFHLAFYQSYQSSNIFEANYHELGGPVDQWTSDWLSKINELSAQGWKINNTFSSNNVENGDYDMYIVYELKRPISDD